MNERQELAYWSLHAVVYALARDYMLQHDLRSVDVLTAVTDAFEKAYQDTTENWEKQFLGH